MKYKIGQTLKLDNTYPSSKNWPKENELLPIFEDGKLVAKYEVKQVNREFIYGKITNTYGHKRRKTNE